MIFNWLKYNNLSQFIRDLIGGSNGLLGCENRSGKKLC